MISFLKSLFKTDPSRKLIKERDRKYQLAVQMQRDGNLREYAKLIKEIDVLEENIIVMQAEPEATPGRDNVTSTDFIDYDGMGNQGRFPTKRNKKEKS